MLLGKVTSKSTQTSSSKLWQRFSPPHIPFFGIFVTNSTNTILLPYHPHTTYWVCLIVNCRRAKAIYSLSIPIYIIRVRLAFFCHYPLRFYLPFFSVLSLDEDYHDVQTTKSMENYNELWNWPLNIYLYSLGLYYFYDCLLSPPFYLQNYCQSLKEVHILKL